jgi:putative protein kinase ArgK-like GTPase of G3E family
MMQQAAAVDYPPLLPDWQERLRRQDNLAITQLISLAENNHPAEGQAFVPIREQLAAALKKSAVIGLTGTGGSGKSSLEDDAKRLSTAFDSIRKIRSKIPASSPSTSPCG